MIHKHTCGCPPEGFCPQCDLDGWLHQAERERRKLRDEMHRLRIRAIELAVAVERERDWSGTPVGVALGMLTEWRPREGRSPDRMSKAPENVTEPIQAGDA